MRICHSFVNNGLGAWFGRCHCCYATSPPVDRPDELRVLAAARRAGWGTGRHEAGWYALFCPRCVSRGYAWDQSVGFEPPPAKGGAA